MGCRWPAQTVLTRGRSVRGNEGGVEYDLPEMAVGILEISRVTAPKRLSCGLDEACAGADGLLHHLIDLLLAADVVADREFGCAAGRKGEPCVVCDVVAVEEGELESGLEIEEGDGAVFEFRADDTFGGEAQAVAVEPQGGFKIIYADRQDAYSGFHLVTFHLFCGGRAQIVCHAKGAVFGRSRYPLAVRLKILGFERG